MALRVLKLFTIISSDLIIMSTPGYYQQMANQYQDLPYSIHPKNDQISFFKKKRINCEQNQAMNLEKATSILDRILKDYKKEVVPIYNSQAVVVETNLWISNMLPLEDTPQHFSLDCTLRMSWVDKRLAFDYDDPDVYAAFDVEVSRQIWIPNVYFPLGKKGVFHDLIARNVFVFIYGNGTVKFSQRLRILSFCPMNFEFYPFDIQECKFKLAVFPQSISYVRLKWMSVPVERSGEDLHILDYSQVKISTNRSIIDGDFNMRVDTLVVTFTLHRDFSAHFLRDYFPCILTVGLSWVSFFVSYKAIPARVSFGINTFLAIVFMSNSIRSTAPVSKTLRSLDYYMLLCMMFVFGALFEFAVVGITDPDFALSWRKNEEKKSSNKEEPKASGSQLQKKEPPECSKIKKVTFGPFVFITGDQHVIDNCAKVVFPLMFLFFNALYFIYHGVHPETVKFFTDNIDF